jgi:hypothetical protein
MENFRSGLLIHIYVNRLSENLSQKVIQGLLALASLTVLRARAKITSHFRTPSSGHLCPILNRKILERALLLLWFRDFGSNKANLNLSANSVKLFLCEPLVLSQYSITSLTSLKTGKGVAILVLFSN